MKWIVLSADHPPANWSGIGVAVSHQTRALAGLGCEVDVVTVGAPGWADDGSGLRLHRLNRDRFPLDVKGDEVVHLHSLSLAGLALELCGRFRLPLVYTAHSLLHLELPGSAEGRRWAAVQRRVLRAAAHVLFLSRAERDAATDLMPGLRGRSSVLPNGLPDPPPSRVDDRRDGPIAFVGRFARSKGIDIAVATARAVIERRRDVRFVFAGGHGEPEAEALLSDLVARHPDRCRAAGWLGREDLDRLYSRAELVLMPSRYEPFGLVALEAMRLGAPVIGAATGGLAEILGPDSGGLVVDGDTPEDWARACERVLADSGLRLALRRRGPAYVGSNYNSRALAERLLASLEHLRGEEAPSSPGALAPAKPRRRPCRN